MKPGSEEDAIRMVREQGLAAFNAADLDRFMAIWPADDVVVMLPSSAPIIGKEALRAFLEQAFAGMRIDEILRSEECVVAGDWAFERLTLSETMTPRSGGAAVQLEGKAVDIYRRQADGSWKVARSILNYNS